MKNKITWKNFIKSLTESEIAAKLNFSPFTGLNIMLNMMIHKQKEANTENFCCSISPSEVTDLLSKNDASKKTSTIYKTKKIIIIKLIPSSKRYQFMTHISNCNIVSKVQFHVHFVFVCGEQENIFFFSTLFFGDDMSLCEFSSRVSRRQRNHLFPVFRHNLRS